MVLSEYQELGVICTLLKQKHEEEIEARALAHQEASRQAQHKHLEDVALVWEMCVLLEQEPVYNSLWPVVAALNVLPDPGPVLEKCFRDTPLTWSWHNNLSAHMLELTHPPYRCKRLVDFVHKAHAALGDIQRRQLPNPLIMAHLAQMAPHPSGPAP